ncbi:MAG TPA: universal stress protein [Pseudonocardiaceae bacterium]|nr:universal stress protein [Pseudonocardiaceae bacterium]
MVDNLIGSPVVSGVDGSAPALNAARWAAGEASTRRAPLLLAYAVATRVRRAGGGFELAEDYQNALESEGRGFMAEAAEQITAAHPDLSVRTEVRVGDALSVLTELSARARLVALGARGLGGFSGMLAGSTAAGLVAHGHAPVAVVRGRTVDAQPPTTGAVVVGVDGSAAGEAAVALAFAASSVRRAELVAVHTWVEFASDSAYAYARQFIVDWAAAERYEEELLADGLAGWQEQYPDVAVRRVLTRDRPLRQLLAHAADAQLLVVGSRGHRRIAGRLLGSTSQALIYHSPCPLLVARPNTATEEPR